MKQFHQVLFTYFHKQPFIRYVVCRSHTFYLHHSDIKGKGHFPVLFFIRKENIMMLPSCRHIPPSGQERHHHHLSQFDTSEPSYRPPFSYHPFCIIYSTFLPNTNPKKNLQEIEPDKHAKEEARICDSETRTILQCRFLWAVVNVIEYFSNGSAPIFPAPIRLRPGNVWAIAGEAAVDGSMQTFIVAWAWFLTGEG